MIGVVPSPSTKALSSSRRLTHLYIKNTSHRRRVFSAQNPSLEQARAIQEHEIAKVADCRGSFDTASRIWKGRGWSLTGTNDEMER